ncbi:MAG: hypothetical protein J5601_01325 [Elusimicrobiaceae bacterium]|nr:hypothetical protein [Elusimicrobiaceae bacterium]
MLDMKKKTDQLALLMAAGFNRVMAERFLQPSNYAYICVVWSQDNFGFFEAAHGITVADVKADKHPGFEYVHYAKDEDYILEVKY